MICETLGLTEFDLSPKEHERIESAFQNLRDSSTVLRTTEDSASPSRKKDSYDMTDYVIQSPPPSPTGLEPESPRFRKISAISDITEYLTQSPPQSPGSFSSFSSSNGSVDNLRRISNSSSECDDNDVHTEVWLHRVE